METSSPAKTAVGALLAIKIDTFRLVVSVPSDTDEVSVYVPHSRGVNSKLGPVVENSSVPAKAIDQVIGDRISAKPGSVAVP